MTVVRKLFLALMNEPCQLGDNKVPGLRCDDDDYEQC